MGRAARTGANLGGAALLRSQRSEPPNPLKKTGYGVPMLPSALRPPHKGKYYIINYYILNRENTTIL